MRKLIIFGLFAGAALVVFKVGIEDGGVAERHLLYPKEAEATRGCYCNTKTSPEVLIAESKYLKIAPSTVLPPMACDEEEDAGTIFFYNNELAVCKSPGEWIFIQFDQ